MTQQQARSLFRRYASCSRIGWYGEAQKLRRQLEANHFSILTDHQGWAGLLEFNNPALLDYKSTVEWRS